MTSPAVESPVDEYERTFAERRRMSEAAVCRWAGHFWLSHLVAPVGMCAALLMTRVWLSAIDLDRVGLGLVTALVGVMLFASLAYSLVATVMSAVSTVRGWPSLRRRVLLFGLTPWMVVSTEALLVMVALFG